MVPRNSTQLLNLNNTKFQVEREPVYKIVKYFGDVGGHWGGGGAKILQNDIDAPPPPLSLSVSKIKSGQKYNAYKQCN